MKANRISHRKMAVFSLLILAAACNWFASEPQPTPALISPTVEAAEASIALTIYNQGTALVRDQRQFALKEGYNEISFHDVAASIDPTSVLFDSLSGSESISVLEQNFEYDLVGTSALYEKYLDEEIIVLTQDGKEFRGRLLSVSGGIVLQSDNGEVTVVTGDVQEVKFPQLPEGLITRPTLVWHLLADKAGPQDVEITYLTGGMSWQSDYVILLAKDEKAIDLDGWVTLSNTSGTTYQDALLKLVAGDLQRVAEAKYAADEIYFEGELAAAAPVEEREFFEYHLYEVPRPVTVRNNETKQIEFVSAAEVPAEKFFVYDGLQCRSNYWYCNFYGYPQTDPSYGIASNPKVMVMIEFDTEEVDADLPKGRVRVYQEDVDGAALLVGEDAIDHTPKGESLRLYVGDAFDIVGERIQKDFRRPSDTSLEEDYEITLRNHKDEAVVVRVVEHLFRWSDWKMLRSSHDYKELDASTIEFSVRVPANGEATVNYSVRYFWP